MGHPGRVVHNDQPLLSRTQQFNLAKIQGIELGGGA